jgi:hypothetical protein
MVADVSKNDLFESWSHGWERAEVVLIAMLGNYDVFVVFAGILSCKDYILRGC